MTSATIKVIDKIKQKWNKSWLKLFSLSHCKKVKKFLESILESLSRLDYNYYDHIHLSCLLSLISFAGNMIYLQIIHQCEALHILIMNRLTSICIFKFINQLNNAMYVLLYCTYMHLNLWINVKEERWLFKHY